MYYVTLSLSKGDLSKKLRHMKPGCVYILRCSDGSLYTGATVDLEQRVTKHNDGTASRYTRSRLPVELIYSQTFQNYNDALKTERQIKKWPREKKLLLVSGDKKLKVELTGSEK